MHFPEIYLLAQVYIKKKDGLFVIMLKTGPKMGFCCVVFDILTQRMKNRDIQIIGIRICQKQKKCIKL